MMAQKIINSSYHIRYEGGYGGREFAPHYGSRQIMMHFSSKKERLMVTINPTLSPKLATLQNGEDSDVLKYVGDDPDYVFFIRNKSKIRDLSGLFSTVWDIAFNDDELEFILYRRDKDLIIEYYKEIDI